MHTQKDTAMSTKITHRKISGKKAVTHGLRVSRSNKWPSEHVEQREFVSWWRKTQPDDLFAIPNGGHRGKVTAQKMKLEGLKSGVWDLMAPDRFLWIEFKRAWGAGSRLSKEQREFGAAREAAGYRLIVAYGCDDAIAQIERRIVRHWTEKPLVE